MVSLAGIDSGASETGRIPSALQEKVELGERVVSQVVAGLDLHRPQGDGEITIRLHPEELGELRINLRLENSQLSVEITAEKGVVRSALMENLDHLKEALGRQQLMVESFSVSSSAGDWAGHGKRDGYRPFQGRPYEAVEPDPREMDGGSAALLHVADVDEHSMVSIRL